MTAVLAAAPSLDPEMVAALKRLLATSSCPKYIRAIAPAWIAEKEASQ